jgi:O-antigen/teichoic acid export membrane protein
MTVVGASVGDALLVRMAMRTRTDATSAMPFFLWTTAALAAVGIPLAAILIAAGPDLFALVFGPEWRDAGVVAAITGPWLAAALVVSPLSRVAIVYEGQAQKLVYDVLNLGAVIGGILGGHAAGLDPFEAIGLTVALQVGAYLVFFVILARMVHRGRFEAGVVSDAADSGAGLH